MSRKTITIIGIILVLSQISGLPHTWKAGFGVAAGLILIFITVKQQRDNSASRSLGEQQQNIPDTSNIKANRDVVGHEDQGTKQKS